MFNERRQPVLLEVNGGSMKITLLLYSKKKLMYFLLLVIPSDITTEVIRSGTFSKGQKGPKVEDVVKVLNAHGIKPSVKKINVIYYILFTTSNKH